MLRVLYTLSFFFFFKFNPFPKLWVQFSLPLSLCLLSLSLFFSKKMCITPFLFINLLSYICSIILNLNICRWTFYLLCSICWKYFPSLMGFFPWFIRFLTYSHFVTDFLSIFFKESVKVMDFLVAIISKHGITLIILPFSMRYSLGENTLNYSERHLNCWRYTTLQSCLSGCMSPQVKIREPEKFMGRLLSLFVMLFPIDFEQCCQKCQSWSHSYGASVL